jgi:hypothetical protein
MTRKEHRIVRLVLFSILLGSIFALSGCGSRLGSPSAGAGTPTQAVDVTNAPGTDYISKYGFAMRYGALLLDDVPSGDRFLELKHLSGDTAVVRIQVPDELYGDPETWLKTAYDSSEYKTYVLDHSPLSGYPAVHVEYGWNVMKVPIRTIVVTAYKDGYFFSLVVTMKEANVEDVRKEFDSVVESFRLLKDKIDLEAMAPWKESLPKGYPLDEVPLFAVDEIQTASGTALDVGGGFHLFYSSKGSYQDLIDHFAEVFDGAVGLDVDKGSEKTKMSGVKNGLDIEVEITYYKSLEYCNVSVRVKKA